MIMKEKFNIEKVNVVINHRIKSVNGNRLPGYSKLAQASVHFNLNDSSYRTNIYFIVPEPIDIEYSERRYWMENRELIADEIFEMCSTYDELKKFQKEMNGRF